MSKIEDQLREFVKLQELGDAAVSLFKISAKSSKFKQISLEHLSPELRDQKLRKWREEFRFVVVSELGNNVFVHVHQTVAERLQNQKDLSINGKQVTVLALTPEEYEALLSVTKSFDSSSERGSSEKEESSHQSLISAKNAAAAQGPSNAASVENLVKLGLGKIVLKALERWNNEIREENRRAEEQALKDEEKRFTILRGEIKKEVLKHEISAAEAKKQHDI